MVRVHQHRTGKRFRCQVDRTDSRPDPALRFHSPPVPVPLLDHSSVTPLVPGLHTSLGHQPLHKTKEHQGRRRANQIVLVRRNVHSGCDCVEARHRLSAEEFQDHTYLQLLQMDEVPGMIRLIVEFHAVVARVVKAFMHKDELAVEHEKFVRSISMKGIFCQNQGIHDFSALQTTVLSTSSDWLSSNTPSIPIVASLFSWRGISKK